MINRRPLLSALFCIAAVALPSTIIAQHPSATDCHTTTSYSIYTGSFRELLEALRRAGPLHNLEATRKIVTSFADRSSTAQGPGGTDSEGAGGAE